MLSQKHMWGVWIGLTLLALALLAFILFKAQDKTFFMPGPLTHGHHQIEMACDVCHTSPMGGSELLQDACIDCHGDQRKKPMDSHPKRKFTDPRNANLIENINVLECITCHQEHRPGITQKGGYTQPVDFCVYCHEDIAEERPTHANLGFETCNSAGCHNFHNNRALYTDFLIKHLEDRELNDRMQLPKKEFASILDQLIDYPADRFPVQALTAQDADAPPEHLTEDALAQWLASGHARSGVNCSACHQKEADSPWQMNVNREQCASCHAAENDTFLSGLHGMRQKVGLPPMTPANAKLPMQPDAQHKELTCNSCHSAHDYSVVTAAVDACLGCHADNHSLAYQQSLHFTLWEKSLAGEIPDTQGVSCASCHMPRINHDVNDWVSRILVQHNQNATLNPNEKMIRPACLHCHGLGFSIDALADTNLIERNFTGRPSKHIQSMDMAKEVHKKSLEETGGELFK